MIESTLSDRAPLKLPSLLDATTAPLLKQQLEEALAAGAGVAIDGSDVARVTSLGLQVLASAATSFRRAGGAGMVFNSMSDSLATSIETLALNALFDSRSGA